MAHANSTEPDQTAPGAVLSESALFVIPLVSKHFKNQLNKKQNLSQEIVE